MLDHQQQQCVDNIAFILLDQLLAQTDATFTGYQKLKKQIAQCVIENKVITLLLPAFPCKTNNLDKVLGYKPDLGEYRVLQKFVNAIRDIQSVYSPGVMFYIFSDYHTFSDYINVDLEHHYTYSDELRNMVGNMNASDCLKIINFEHFSAFDDLNEYQYFNGLKQRFGDAEYERDFARLKQHDNAMHHTYLGLKKFMHQDQRYALAPLSYKKRRERLALMAKGMMVQGRALDNFLNTHLSHAIRLSIHEHPMQGKKYSLFLFDERSFKTPWHTCVLFDACRGEFIIDTQANHKQREGVIIPVMHQGTLWCLLRFNIEDANEAQLMREVKATLQTEQFGLTLESHHGCSLTALPQAHVSQLVKAFSAVCLKGFGPLPQASFWSSWFAGNHALLPEEYVRSSTLAEPSWYGLKTPSTSIARRYSYADMTPDEWAIYCSSAPLKVNLLDASLAALCLNGQASGWLKNTIVQYDDTATYPVIMSGDWGMNLRWSPSLAKHISSSTEIDNINQVANVLTPILERSQVQHVFDLQLGDILLVNNHTVLRYGVLSETELAVRQPYSVNSPWQPHNKQPSSEHLQESPA